jgi:hypothetical protein
VSLYHISQSCQFHRGRQFFTINKISFPPLQLQKLEILRTCHRRTPSNPNSKTSKIYFPTKIEEEAWTKYGNEGQSQRGASVKINGLDGVLWRRAEKEWDDGQR